MWLINSYIEEIKQLKDCLKAVLDDATGDINNQDKRVWPIRMENYRKIQELLGLKKEKKILIENDEAVCSSCASRIRLCRADHDEILYCPECGEVYEQEGVE